MDDFPVAPLEFSDKPAASCSACEGTFLLEELYECDEIGDGLLMRICRPCEIVGIEMIKEIQKDEH